MLVRNAMPGFTSLLTECALAVNGGDTEDVRQHSPLYICPLTLPRICPQVNPFLLKEASTTCEFQKELFWVDLFKFWISYSTHYGGLHIEGA